MAETVTPAPKKPWALLAYTIAEDTHSDSPLDTTARRELKAICAAADFQKVSVAAQVDLRTRRGVYRASLTQWDPQERAFEDVDPSNYDLWDQVKASVAAGTARVNVQREARDLNATDAGVLDAFLRYGRERCPADRYVVSFFGHAAGPLGLFDDRTPGQAARTTMRLPALVRELRAAGGKADVVLFRDCFMSCLEVAYQLRGATEFMVATQALAPRTGTWPWRAFLKTLTADATPLAVAEGMAQALAAYLDARPSNREDLPAVPYTVLDLGAADEVATRLASLVEALEAARQDPARRRACANAIEGARVGAVAGTDLPGDPALVDVPTMCARLAALSGEPAARAAVALGRVVGSKLVRWHHSQTPHHLGAALFYAPVTPADLEATYLYTTNEPVASDDAAHYRALALSKATGWHRIAYDPLPIDD